MLETEVVVSASPHLRAGLSAERIMWLVVAALIPAAGTGVFYFGRHALLIILVSIATAVITEALTCILMKRPLTIGDGSAVVTGLLLALTLPPTVPLWIPAAGSAFAIVLGKQIYGGLGYNLFNPALVGRAFLLASWPVLMTKWVWPEGSLGWVTEPPAAALGLSVDAVAGSTALGLWGEGLNKIPYLQMYLGKIAGSLGETSALAILLGGLFLLVFKIIDWRIPVGFLGTVVVLAFLWGEDPLFHLLAGGLLLGAFFMATDYVTTPVTPRGRLIFGVGCGLFTMLIRMYGGLPEGVCYSILLMNIATPLLDRWTVPKRFGEVRANG